MSTSIESGSSEEVDGLDIRGGIVEGVETKLGMVWSPRAAYR